jgi:hypothetical protein
MSDIINKFGMVSFKARLNQAVKDLPGGSVVYVEGGPLHDSYDIYHDGNYVGLSLSPRWSETWPSKREINPGQEQAHGPVVNPHTW